MAYSTPASLSSGNTLPAAHMNVLRANDEEFAKPPMAWAYKTSNQSISNATDTTVTWQATSAIRNFTLAANALTPVETGWFQVNLIIAWAGNATGHRSIRIYTNGAMIHEGHATPGNATWSKQSLSAFIIADTNDLITVVVYQDSGGALNINSAFTSFQVYMISRL